MFIHASWSCFEDMRHCYLILPQAEVVRAFGDGEGPPWQHSLFGNPSDPETVRRRTEVAEQLAERNFDLAFRVIYDFRLPGKGARAGYRTRSKIEHLPLSADENSALELEGYGMVFHCKGRLKHYFKARRHSVGTAARRFRCAFFSCPLGSVSSSKNHVLNHWNL
jgi:hypothetical protein